MRWAVFISGTGSNLTSLLDACESWNIALVVSNKPNAPGVRRARRRGVPVWLIDQIGKKESSWVDLANQLKAAGIQAIALAGFMKIVPAAFLNAWNGLIINLHPSLLPSYPGLESLRRAYDDNAPIGVTIHHVVPEVDAGPFVIQKSLRTETTFEETEVMAHISEQRLLLKGVGICDQK